MIDPIYKVITGDENSASEMANFCNQFDKIAEATGASVIYAHHHSKGAQGSKNRWTELPALEYSQETLMLY